MKYRIIASVILLLVLGVVYAAFNKPNDSPTSSQPADDAPYQGLGK